MRSNITKSDVISAITLYIASNDEGRSNCPVNYLIDEKFGKQNKKLVLKIVADLKKAGAIIGKRGRTGGLCFPESVAVDASPVDTDETVENESDEDVIEQDGMEIESVPF